jgi:hypothetical protein
MKFWNKYPEVRKLHWTKVALPQEDNHGLWPSGETKYFGWYQRGQFDDLKCELQNTPSDGRFYMMIMKKEVWFERAEDATMFILKNS